MVEECKIGAKIFIIVFRASVAKGTYSSSMSLYLPWSVITDSKEAIKLANDWFLSSFPYRISQSKVQLPLMLCHMHWLHVYWIGNHTLPCQVFNVGYILWMRSYRTMYTWICRVTVHVRVIAKSNMLGGFKNFSPAKWKWTTLMCYNTNQ